MEIFYGDIDYYNECKKKFYYLYSKSQVFKNHIDRHKSAIVEWKDLPFNDKIIYCPCIDGRYIGIEKDYEKVLEKVPKLKKILFFVGLSQLINSCRAFIKANNIPYINMNLSLLEIKDHKKMYIQMVEFIYR